MGLKCNNKKYSYDSKFDAEKRLNEIINNQPARDKTPNRSYKCICGKWHLTSLDKSSIDKHIQKTNDKVKKRESKFINIETEYWNKKFGIND